MAMGLAGDLALESSKGFLKLFIWIKNEFYLLHISRL